LSSSYFEGKTCPLAAIGHNRDGKKGKLQVDYGLLTDRRGCPVAVSIVEGNTAGSKTFLPQVRKLRDAFGLEHMVLVGDRGMISNASIAELRDEKFGWITALKSGQIRALVDSGELQLGLFDERNLFELSHPDFPGERLIACRNPELAKLRVHKRDALLAATKSELEKVRGMVARGKLKGSAVIGVRVGKAFIERASLPNSPRIRASPVTGNHDHRPGLGVSSTVSGVEGLSPRSSHARC
jgi:transposase